MRILHTSDLHLLEPGDERWNTLQRMVNICSDEEVDILTICGDLFDQNPKTEDLRGSLQELFTEVDLDILIIPGNHDEEVCSDMYFGRKARILSDPKKYEDESVSLIGLPYEKLGKEKVLDKINSSRHFVERNDEYPPLPWRTP